MLEKIIGVYSITNLINGKIYIGSSVDIKQRHYEHISDLRRNVHHSIHLQRAWNKYSEDDFKFEIIELVIDNDKLLEREQYWMDYYNCYHRDYGYNLHKIAGSPLGYKHSEETKKLLSIKGKGLKRSEETKQKISVARKGLSNTWLIGVKQSEEHLKNRFENMRGRPLKEESKINMRTPIIQLSRDGEFIREWTGASEASKILDIDISGITKCCRGRQKTHKGFKWIYKDNFYKEKNFKAID